MRSSSAIGSWRILSSGSWYVYHPPDEVTCLIPGPLILLVEGRPVSLAIMDAFESIARNRWALGESGGFESDISGLFKFKM